jgi:hypothetical protein
VKIALGTVEVSDAARAAIAAFYGGTGLASREDCRQFIVGEGIGAIDGLGDLPEHVEPGSVFVSSSGRRWRAQKHSRYWPEGTTFLLPIGGDTTGFGGVKGAHVDTDRLLWQTHGWRRDDASSRAIREGADGA